MFKTIRRFFRKAPPVHTPAPPVHTPKQIDIPEDWEATLQRNSESYVGFSRTLEQASPERRKTASELQTAIVALEPQNILEWYWRIGSKFGPMNPPRGLNIHCAVESDADTAALLLDREDRNGGTLTWFTSEDALISEVNRGSNNLRERFVTLKGTDGRYHTHLSWLV